MKINHHLTKQGPTYYVRGRDYRVKLLKQYSPGKFTAEIMSGEHKGKWTDVKKEDLKIVINNAEPIRGIK